MGWEELAVQKFVQGVLVALAMLLGGLHAQAGTVAMTPDGFVDLGKFDELGKAIIVKTAENMVMQGINDLPKNTFAGQDGALKLKKLLAVSFTLLAAEASRVGLEPLARLNGFKAMILTDNIRGTTDFKKMQVYDAKIEEEKQQYFDSVLAHHTKQSGALSQAEVDAHALPIKNNILSIAMEKTLAAK